MTIAECIKNWLSEYGDVDFTELATDFIEADVGSYAICKSPNGTEIQYLDGSKLVTEYYQIFARQPTQLEQERISNQQFLAELETWVEDRNYNEEYPDLSQAGCLICEDISISNSSTILSQEDDNAIYQLTIAIQYLKERGLKCQKQ